MYTLSNLAFIDIIRSFCQGIPIKAHRDACKDDLVAPATITCIYLVYWGLVTSIPDEGEFFGSKSIAQKPRQEVLLFHQTSRLL